MWRLVFDSDVEGTSMTSLLHQEGRFGSIKLVQSRHLFFFIEVSVSKPGKRYIMYLCIKGTDFASFGDFCIELCNCSDSVVSVNSFSQLFGTDKNYIRDSSWVRKLVSNCSTLKVDITQVHKYNLIKWNVKICRIL